jgi:hypothetical protein
MFSDANQDVELINQTIRKVACALRKPGLKKKQHVDLIGFVRFLDEKRNGLLDNDGVPIRKRCKPPLDEQINDVLDNDGVPLKKRRKTSG